MSLHVFKDTRGAWRWTSYSSTAYQDRDKEIVSTRALADDCDRADRDGQYGPLLWWHTSALTLGDCDFNAMHGRVLIESGTFRSEAIARKVAAAADRLGVSIGFLHALDAPRNGVFDQIERIERSILPLDKAANLFTGFAVKETTMATLREQWEKAKRELGLTDDDLLALQGGAEQREKMARALGIAYKTTDVKQLDGLDEAYVQLRDALDAADSAGVGQALAQLTTLAESSMAKSANKAARRDPVVAAIQGWIGGR